MHDSDSEILPAQRLRVEALRPADWGIDAPCFVRLEDPVSGEVRLLTRVEPGATAEWHHDGTSDKLLLTFRRVGTDGSAAGMIGSAHRWVPSNLRSSAEFPEETAGLTSTTIDDVVLSPHVRMMLGSGALTTRGYIGAWSHGEPIPQAMDFALGRQYYNFKPVDEPTVVRAGQVIYLGPPQQGWGHFLTQGLSRLWYALEHPHIPVVWDAPELRPYQQDVLRILGLENEMLFLKEPTRWESVVFPHPGLCIGEFALPEFIERIGRVPQAPQVTGKRLFLSRSGLNDGVTDDERRLDGIAEAHGFSVFRPEQHSVAQQLDEISSAEAVLGIEGSALHTPILLQGRIATKFWALTRHRGGSGVFEHIKRAKGLEYETLNFLHTKRKGGHRSPFDVDVEAFEETLRITSGLTERLEALDGRKERPWPGETSFQTHLRHAQVHQPPEAELLARIHLRLRETEHKDLANAAKLLI